MGFQYIRYLVIGTLAACIGMIAYASPLIDVPKLAGQTMKQVSERLKATPTCTKNKYGTKCDYDGGRIEIVYIYGKADWITVNGLAQVPFVDAAIATLGFSQTAPSFRSPMVMRWNGLPDVREVSVFKGQTGSDYAYIKVKTP